jgi:hypothetical protein
MNSISRLQHRIASSTDYHGHDIWMRSTAEARWAMFFEKLGHKWQYEPKQFQLSKGLYTPDFLVENVGWLEIKPTKDHVRESWRKIQLLVKEHFKADERIFIFYDCHIPLNLDSTILVSQRGIFRPNCKQMSDFLAIKVPPEFRSSIIQAALNYASYSKVENFAPASAFLIDVIEEMESWQQ